MRRLRQIGPRPFVLAAFLGHHVFRRVRSRMLPLVYRHLVCTPPEGASLAPLTVWMPPARDLPEALVDAATQVRAQADGILAHNVDILASGLISLGEQIDWHRDFKTGHSWPRAAYGSVARIQPGSGSGSEIRIPWELSRSHHLLTLARAACLFEDERYARELELQLQSWLDDNPPGIGVNWINPMEVGLRAVNWIWAIAT